MLRRFVLPCSPRSVSHEHGRSRPHRWRREEAAAVLAAVGLTPSDAFRLMMVRVAKDKALPFNPLVPNAETIDAMRAARRGELTTVAPGSDLVAALDADG